MEYDVEHNEELGRFQIKYGEETAFVSYSVYGDTINFNRTYTPPALRGRGMAASLVRKAFEYSLEKKLKVTSECSYVLTFVQRYNTYKELMK